jgi:hypothetical protein
MAGGLERVGLASHDERDGEALVERLEHEGWVVREASARRGVALSLTKAGQRLVAQLLAAREASLSRLLDHLSDSQLVQIATAAEAVLAAQTNSRADLERLCRLCHRTHCPDCPVASSAPD